MIISPITPGFVAEIGDVNVGEVLDNQTKKEIREAFSKYSILIFPDQELSDQEHLRFAEIFGPLEKNIPTFQDDVKKFRIDSRIADVSNLDDEDQIVAKNSRKRMSGMANRLWHTSL